MSEAINSTMGSPMSGTLPNKMHRDSLSKATKPSGDGDSEPQNNGQSEDVPPKPVFDNEEVGCGDGGEAEPETKRIVIDPTKDLWYNITANVKDSSQEPPDINLLIVGSSFSGKTTLLQRIGNSDTTRAGGAGGKNHKAIKLKPTTALDYTYTRRSERNTSQVAHLWELAQGTELSQLCEIVITPENIHSIVLVIVVDASEEGLPVAWETATYWLRRIDRRASEVMERLKAKGSSTPAKMLFRMKKMVGLEHPELDKMRFSGIPTVLVINKVDAFRGDMSKMKVLVRSMRFLAHLYAAHIIFTSENERHKWHTLINHVIFQTPFDPKNIQFDPERGGVLITANKDSFIDIGYPSYLNSDYNANDDAKLEQWQLGLDALFPPRKLPESKSLSDPFLRQLYNTSEGGYGEPSIDALRKQKDEELEQYKKSIKAKTGTK